MWDARAATWEQGFAALQGFVEREGHAQVPRKHREGDHNLGDWVTTQRFRLFRKGKLDPKRQARLEAVPGWTWEVK